MTATGEVGHFFLNTLYLAWFNSYIYCIYCLQPITKFQRTHCYMITDLDCLHYEGMVFTLNSDNHRLIFTILSNLRKKVNNWLCKMTMNYKSMGEPRSAIISYFTITGQNTFSPRLWGWTICNTNKNIKGESDI